MQVLQGVKVVDLSRYISGPNCCQLLGDLGADVIKVESPKGEPVREYEPLAPDGTSFYYMVFNRNKRGITLNTRSPQGKEILRRLFLEADIVVENFKPGTMDAMGFSWDELKKINPRLILVSISGFGQTGPMAKLPGFDSILQATGGLMSLTGSPEGEPYLCGTFVIDYCTSVYCAYAAMAALWARERTGLGQRVEASLLDTAMSLLIDAVPEDLVLGRTRTRRGNLDKCTAPVGCFSDINGEYIYIIAAPQEHWEKLARLIGRPELLEDERFATVPVRHCHAAEVNAYVQEWALNHTKEQICDTLSKLGIPAAPVLSVGEFIRLPQVRHNNQIINVPYRGVGDVPMQGFPVKLSETPAAISRGAPNLGEHNGEVLSGLGYGEGEIEELCAAGVI
jgi:crotonobetainyl-CoA:carnitine CoA-transferase CaiB-like acyl-CoA transferase